MSKTLTDKLAQIEKLIKTAHGSEAQKALLKLRKREKIDGHERTYAALARRAYVPELGLRALHPIICEEGRRRRDASPTDLVEYAACLVRAGAVEEAESYLQRPEMNSNPNAFFWRGAIKLKKWEYEPAAQHFNTYLSFTEITKYEALAGKLNLAFIYIHLKSFSRAKSLLLEVLAESSPEKEKLTYSAALRSLGNLELAQNNFDPAIDYFTDSLKKLSDSASLDLYFCDKWLTISRFLKDSTNAALQKDLDRVRSEGVAHNHWESVRDIDLHRAVALRDEKLIYYLYYGTPYESFRKRLVESYGPLNLDQDFIWKLGAPGKKTITFSLTSYTHIDDPELRLKIGQTIHRLLLTLMSDFYRPFSRLELFERIFPGERYAPKVSELRVHQLLFRVREWLVANKIPLSIEGDRNEYRLAAEPGVEVICATHGAPETTDNIRIQKLSTRFPQGFTTGNAATALGISRRTAASLILTAIGEGKLVKKGGGRSRYYDFPSYDTPSKKAG